MPFQQGSNCDCLIVGGGFTGLAAAVKLTRLGRTVILCERDASLGGLAGGFDVGGQELEKFYHHWFVSDQHVTTFTEDIGRADRIITRATRTGMYYAGNFYRLSSPMDLLRFKAVPLVDRIRMGVVTLAVRRIRDWKYLEGITARDWLVSLFGKATFEVVWEPLLIGKFGKYADEISAVWFWNKLTLRGGSRAKGGGEALSYYRGGFGMLARDAGAFIEQAGGTICTNVSVEKITTSENGGLFVATSNGTLHPKSVLVTVPLPQAAQLMEGSAPPDYLAGLRRVKFIGNVCLILVSRKSLSDLYWVNVNDPSFPFVGVIEHTNFEAPESYGGRHIIYLSKYLPVEHELYSMTADALLAFAVPHLQRMFPDFSPDFVERAYLWRAPYSQPIVERFYSRLIPPFESPIANVFLASMAQVYPEDRGTNYAIGQGKAAAQRIDGILGSPVRASARERARDSTNQHGLAGAMTTSIRDSDVPR